MGLSCSTLSRPDKTYIRADAALKHAARHQAGKFAPKIYRKAEKYFIKGKRDYQSQYFGDAKLAFQLAIKYAKLAMRKAYVAKEKDAESLF